MSNFVMGIAAVMWVAGGVVAAEAQTDGQQHAATSDHTQNAASQQVAPAQKRGISEEGGMKASGPSQGKHGESR